MLHPAPAHIRAPETADVDALIALLTDAFGARYDQGESGGGWTQAGHRYVLGFPAGTSLNGI